MLFWDQHKTITDYYELLSEEVCDKYGLTQMEYDILLFLHSDPRHNTAADIVAVRKSTKSHVSIENNKKRVEIFLTHRAEPIIAEGLQTQKQFAADVLKGLSEEERAGCIRVFRKIHQNADECLKKHRGAKL